MKLGEVFQYAIFLKIAENCCDRDRVTWLDMHSNFKMAPIFFHFVLGHFEVWTSKWPQTSVYLVLDFKMTPSRDIRFNLFFQFRTAKKMYMPLMRVVLTIVILLLVYTPRLLHSLAGRSWSIQNWVNMKTENLSSEYTCIYNIHWTSKIIIVLLSKVSIYQNLPLYYSSCSINSSFKSGIHGPEAAGPKTELMLLSYATAGRTELVRSQTDPQHKNAFRLMP